MTTFPEWLALAEATRKAKGRIYTASKTTHAEKWRNIRSQGMPIISTWIDEAVVGETLDWLDLWRRCVNEAATATALIVYREPNEILKGAWVEVGAALSHNVPVYAIGCNQFSVRHHPLFKECNSLFEAFGKASRAKENE